MNRARLWFIVACLGIGLLLILAGIGVGHIIQWLRVR